MASTVPEIRLVVFDLGRVLLRICSDWKEACRRAGVEVPRVELDEAADAALHAVVRRNEIGALDLEGFVAATSPIFRLTPAQVRAMSHAYLHAGFPGGPELIDELHACGLATACLSNTNESHWRIMNDPAEAAHLPLHRLTYRFASHLVGARKPDAAIYEHLERESAVAPESILFFDDIPENVQAARQRGWHGVRVDPTSENPIPAMRSELRQRGILASL